MHEKKVKVIEERAGLERYPLFMKRDMIYLHGQVIAGSRDSFWYLGHGYYQLNGKLYYMGMEFSRFPKGGAVITYTEDRTDPKPDDFPQDVMYCYTAKHADVLETPDGFRIEYLRYDN